MRSCAMARASPARAPAGGASIAGQSIMAAGSCRLVRFRVARGLGQRGMNDRAVAGEQRPLDDLVRRIDLKLLVLVDDEAKEIQEISCVELARIDGNARGHVGMTDDLDAIVRL